MYASTAKHKILRMRNMVILEMSGFPRFGFTVSHLSWWISCKLQLEDSCVNEDVAALKKLNYESKEQLLTS